MNCDDELTAEEAEIVMGMFWILTKPEEAYKIVKRQSEILGNDKTLALMFEKKPPKLLRALGSLLQSYSDCEEAE